MIKLKKCYMVLCLMAIVICTTKCTKAKPTIQPNVSTISTWEGATYASIGDSITHQDSKAYIQGDVGKISVGYQTLLKNETKISSVSNYGISGASMAKNSNYPKNGSSSIDGLNKIYTNTDLVTIASGTNDFKLNVKIGSIGKIDDSSFDNTTFYGAYRELVEYILDSNDTVTLVLFTPIYRNNAGYDMEYTNKAGHKLEDYRNAIIEIGKMYNLPVLDLYTESGINASNTSIYLMDGLHPNDLGYAQMSKVIIPFIKNIK